MWWRLRRLIVSISVAGATAAGPAAAVEPPWEEDRLFEESGLVVEGLVLAVKLEAIEGEEPQTFRVYRAWLDVGGLVTGEVAGTGTLEIVFRRLIARPDSPIGFADAVYEPGERVRAFLKWTSEERAWTTVQWSGKQTLDSSEAELPLPESVGDAAIAVDSEVHRPGCEARGGVWRPLFRTDRTRVCVLPTADAGRSCADSSECDGICHTKDAKLGPATGQCSALAPIGGGCWNEIVEGVAQGMTCRD